MNETDSELNALLNTIMRIGHGDLNLWVPAGRAVAQSEPWLFGHFLGYNFLENRVRDSHVALPPIALHFMPDSLALMPLRVNAVAYMMLLGPRELYRSIQWNKQLTSMGYPLAGGYKRILLQAVTHYLRIREANEAWFRSTVASHREAIHGLYAIMHIKPSPMAQAILYGVPTDRPHYGIDKHGERYQKGWEAGPRDPGENNILADIKRLPTVDALTGQEILMAHDIPAPVSKSIVGKRGDPVMLMAMMRKMTGNQFLKSIRFFKRHHVLQDPMMKALFDEAMHKTGMDKRVARLGAQHVLEELAKDEDPTGAIASVRAQLSQVQEEVFAQEAGIEGDWAVLCDCSSSMHSSIELGRRLSSLITKQIKGKVYLVFFHTSAMFFDVTGKTFEQIVMITREIGAHGNTSCGIGLDYLLKGKIPVQGIIEISDGGHNTNPGLGETYKAYAKWIGFDPTLYYFHVGGERSVLEHHLAIHKVKYEYQDLTGSDLDWNSLPGVLSVLHVNPHSVLDKIRNTPLLTLDDVFVERVRA